MTERRGANGTGAPTMRRFPNADRPLGDALGLAYTHHGRARPPRPRCRLRLALRHAESDAERAQRGVSDPSFGQRRNPHGLSLDSVARS
jgi:hypothetical protein